VWLETSTSICRSYLLSIDRIKILWMSTFWLSVISGFDCISPSCVSQKKINSARCVSALTSHPCRSSSQLEFVLGSTGTNQVLGLFQFISCWISECKTSQLTARPSFARLGFAWGVRLSVSAKQWIFIKQNNNQNESEARLGKVRCIDRRRIPVGIKALALVDRHFNKWCSKGGMEKETWKITNKNGEGFLRHEDHWVEQGQIQARNQVLVTDGHSV
jgi:hypothetical protein